MKPLLALVAAALAAAAAGVWFLVLDEGGGREAAAPGGAVAEPRAEAARPPADVRAPESASAEETARGARRAEPSAALQRAYAEAAPARPLHPAVEGRVVDAGGQPVAGAEVLATAHRKRTHLALDSTAFREWARSRTVRTATDADGRFAFTGPVPGPLRVAVRAAGFAPLDRDDLVLPAEEDVDLGVLVLEPGVQLFGRVVGPGARGVAGAEVLSVPLLREFGIARTARDLGRPVAETDTDGRFRIDCLAPGPWKLLVRSAEHPDQLAEGVAELGGLEEEVEIRLGEGHTLGGEVVGERTRALVVRASPAGVQRIAPGGGSPEYREAPVDAAGRFLLRGLADAWPYLLRVRAADDLRPNPAWLAAPVQARAGETNARLVLRRGAELVLHVVDAETSEPLEAFSVALSGEFEDLAWREYFDTEDENLEHDPETGRARVRSLQSVGSGGATELQVRSAGYTIERREGLRLAPGETLDVGVVALTPLPRVRALVRNAEGEPVVRAIVHLSALDASGEAATGDAPGRAFAVTDEDGTALVAGPAGEHAFLWATHASYAPSEAVRLVVPADGQPDVELVLTDGASVTAVVRSAGGRALAGRPVQRQEYRAEIAGGRWFGVGGTTQVVTNAEGRAAFPALRPGRHRFRAVPAGGKQVPSEWAEARVAEGEQRELELTAPAVFTLRGRVAEAGYPLAGARVWLHAGHERSFRRSLLGPRGFDPATRSGVEGRYELTDVVVGDYLLIVRHPDRAMDAEIPLRFEQEATYEYDVELPITRVSGTVTDPDGRPVGGIAISVQRAHDARWLRSIAITVEGSDGESVTTSTSELARVARTDAAGRYELRGVAAEEDIVVIARGEHVRTVKSGVFRVPVDGVRDDVHLVVEPAGTLQIVVTRADGNPAPNASVHASYRGRRRGQAEVHHEVTGSGGAVLLLGLTPGPWRVRVSPREDDEEADRWDDEAAPAREVPAREVEVEARRRARVEFRLED